jgi:hypothetical protein
MDESAKAPEQRKKKAKKKGHQQALTIGVIEELRRKGYNQTDIAEMHGVSRQAVSWHKVEYNGEPSVRQHVGKHWPWVTTKLHGKSPCYQRLRDHGEYVMTGGKGMSEDKLSRLRKWWKVLKVNNWVLEFDPNLPAVKGISPYGGFAYRKRVPGDGELLIRVNEYTNLTPEGRRLWGWNSTAPDDDL